jgi:hypothetical protein
MRAYVPITDTSLGQLALTGPKIGGLSSHMKFNSFHSLRTRGHIKVSLLTRRQLAALEEAYSYGENLTHSAYHGGRDDVSTMPLLPRQRIPDPVGRDGIVLMPGDDDLELQLLDIVEEAPLDLLDISKDWNLSCFFFLA